eukprot:COSAG06_NODE_2856_length_6169_cov_2.934267_5_plen_177_part_00
MVRSAGLTLRTILPSPSACRLDTGHAHHNSAGSHHYSTTAVLYTIILYILDLGIYLYSTNLSCESPARKSHTGQERWRCTPTPPPPSWRWPWRSSATESLHLHVTTWFASSSSRTPTTTQAGSRRSKSERRLTHLTRTHPPFHPLLRCGRPRCTGTTTRSLRRRATRTTTAGITTA